MIFRMVLFFCLTFLISCSTLTTPHHKILGTTYGFSDSSYVYGSVASAGTSAYQNTTGTLTNNPL